MTLWFLVSVAISGQSIANTSTTFYSEIECKTQMGELKKSLAGNGWDIKYVDCLNSDLSKTLK